MAGNLGPPGLPRMKALIAKRKILLRTSTLNNTKSSRILKLPVGFMHTHVKPFVPAAVLNLHYPQLDLACRFRRLNFQGRCSLHPGPEPPLHTAPGT
jgi:hypothetical protein